MASNLADIASNLASDVFCLRSSLNSAAACSCFCVGVDSRFNGSAGGGCGRADMNDNVRSDGSGRSTNPRPEGIAGLFPPSLSGTNNWPAVPGLDSPGLIVFEGPGVQARTFFVGDGDRDVAGDRDGERESAPARSGSGATKAEELTSCFSTLVAVAATITEEEDLGPPDSCLLAAIATPIVRCPLKALMRAGGDPVGAASLRFMISGLILRE